MRLVFVICLRMSSKKKRTNPKTAVYFPHHSSVSSCFPCQSCCLCVSPSLSHFLTFSRSFYLLAVVPPLYHKLYRPICFRFLFPSSCCFFPFIQHFVQSFNSASSPTYGILLTSSAYWYTAGFQLPSIHFKWVGVHNLDTVQLHLFSCFLSPSSCFLRLISLLKDKR